MKAFLLIGLSLALVGCAQEPTVHQGVVYNLPNGVTAYEDDAGNWWYLTNSGVIGGDLGFTGKYKSTYFTQEIKPDDADIAAATIEDEEIDDSKIPSSDDDE